MLAREEKEMEMNDRARPRSAVGMMALIALPFLLGSGVAAAHQMARALPEAAVEAPPATVVVDVAPQPRG
ncbi:MAG TPA: hypothetical protein VK837_10690 [Longimicrobiales bacterium]|nr:hypothetical protein [Longimicrobiales bacterium]